MDEAGSDVGLTLEVSVAAGSTLGVGATEEESPLRVALGATDALDDVDEFDDGATDPVATLVEPVDVLDANDSVAELVPLEPIGVVSWGASLELVQAANSALLNTQPRNLCMGTRAFRPITALAPAPQRFAEEVQRLKIAFQKGAYKISLRLICTNRTVIIMVAKTYGSEEARTLLPELLERASRGASMMITKRGKLVAALVPPEGVNLRRTPITSLRGSGQGLWGAEPAFTIADMRDEWP